MRLRRMNNYNLKYVLYALQSIHGQLMLAKIYRNNQPCKFTSSAMAHQRELTESLQENKHIFYKTF